MNGADAPWVQHKLTRPLNIKGRCSPIKAAPAVKIPHNRELTGTSLSQFLGTTGQFPQLTANRLVQYTLLRIAVVVEFVMAAPTFIVAPMPPLIQDVIAIL